MSDLIKETYQGKFFYLDSYGECLVHTQSPMEFCLEKRRMLLGAKLSFSFLFF